MGPGYQDRDRDIIDYKLYKLPGFGRPFRGPQPSDLSPGRFFAAIGAAQTFGCYCPFPFPFLLQEATGLNALNLGVAGAGPKFFTGRPAFIGKANQARFVIVQVMSGRSESNSLFESKGGEVLLRRSDGVRQGAGPMYAEMMASSSKREVMAIVEETRGNWLANMKSLLEAIKVPKVLL